MLVNTRTLQIEWGDCDPAGIVYFPRYYEMFDACTSALFTRAGLPKQDLIAKYSILGIPVVETRARFLAPSSFGDTVLVESTITEWGKSSFGVHHKLFKGDLLAVEGFEKRVWTIRLPGEPRSIKSSPIPKEVMDRFALPAA